jgi:hypothetical protein
VLRYPGGRLLIHLRVAGAGDGRCHSAPVGEMLVGGVDDHIDLELGDIPGKSP